MGIHGWGVHELAAVASIVRDVFILVGLTVAGKQVVEAARSRTLNATSMLLEEIARTDLRMSRHAVIHDLKKTSNVAAMNKEDRELITFVASTYDRIGYLIRQNLLPAKPLFDFHGEDIELLRDKIWPVVKYYREEAEPKRPNYCNSFRWLATVWLPSMRNQ
jgi:hypothetical protein